jgi:hypothetical protein
MRHAQCRKFRMLRRLKCKQPGMAGLFRGVPSALGGARRTGRCAERRRAQFSALGRMVTFSMTTIVESVGLPACIPTTVLPSTTVLVNTARRRAVTRIWLEIAFMSWSFQRVRSSMKRTVGNATARRERIATDCSIRGPNCMGRFVTPGARFTVHPALPAFRRAPVHFTAVLRSADLRGRRPRAG